MSKTITSFSKVLVALVVLTLAACSSPLSKRETYEMIQGEINKAAQTKEKSPQPDAVAAALLPPLKLDLPKARAPLEERFSLTFNNVPAQQFFMALVSGTRFNMLMHPEVTGNISINLKDVTLFEALDSVRQIYGYDYKVDGTRIFIKPLTIQTRVFQVNYLTGNRKGSSDIRVSSGSVSDAGSSAAGSNGGGTSQPASGSGGGRSLEGSRISTATLSDFWTELKTALETIVGSVGSKDGRSVVISPQSGVVVIRAMPDELQNVDQYLKASQISVDRQVILEAKILEVQLNDSFQTGVNWASFASFSGKTENRVATGFLAPGTALTPLPFVGGKPDAIASTGNTALNAITGFSLGVPGTATASMFGLALQTANFATLISFLESQGTVHVLSSPRIATLNNQKAVLKIGTDEFFVTGVSTTTTTGANNTNTVTPNVTLQPFFSGVVLDVTPQIDDQGNIILHVHPSVSQVSTVSKIINLGSLGTFTLPLASSSTSETDSVVRGQDGRIVAIGGLMRQSSLGDRSQVPGAGDLPLVGALFRNTSQVLTKRELVILLKPTIVEAGSFSADAQESERRIGRMEPH